jgi:hypothetical protein
MDEFEAEVIDELMAQDDEQYRHELSQELIND